MKNKNIITNIVKMENIITMEERINFNEGFRFVKNEYEAIQQIKTLTLGSKAKGKLSKVDSYVENGTIFYMYEVNRDLYDENEIVAKDKYVFKCFQNEGENVYIDEVYRYKE